MRFLIRKAVVDDTNAIWAIRNAAILAQCAGFYSVSDLRVWTDGVPTDRFEQSVIDTWYHASVCANDKDADGITVLGLRAAFL